jgi:hypothetical protein
VKEKKESTEISLALGHYDVYAARLYSKTTSIAPIII